VVKDFLDGSAKLDNLRFRKWLALHQLLNLSVDIAVLCVHFVSSKLY
jgi:hypothetical protein